ncbi:MAG: TolC family protein [Burkholderiales bacterium]|nr:TolC family protein [Burkholderiales bacterium]
MPSRFNGICAAGLLAWACVAHHAAAADLVEVWRAAAQNDADYAVGRAAGAQAQPRRDQASALWKPTVGLTAAVGVASSETETRGAQFSAPGFGQSNNVGFGTSVTGGTSSRWAVAAMQPLYDPQRRAQQRQLNLSADLADQQWRAAGQSLMLRTAERYFDLALAQETLHVLRRQLDAVQRAATEAQDRFKLGSVPVTDTHEAGARLAGVRAQVLAAESELEIKRSGLADSTGLAPAALVARMPAGAVVADAAALPPLDRWLSDARAGNPALQTQRLAAEVARQEAGKYSRRASATVDLVVQAGRDRLSGSGDFGPASNTATNRMIGIQLSVPLYSGGYRDAKQEEALRQADQASAEVDRTRIQVGQQVRAAWLGLSVGAERVRALEEALTASLARRDATQLGLEVGERTTLDLLNAENDAASARLALAQGRVGLLLDRLRLQALAGRLDEAALRGVDAELEAAAAD